MSHTDKHEGLQSFMCGALVYKSTQCSIIWRISSSLFIFLIIGALCLPDSQAAPQGTDVLIPNPSGDLSDPDMVQLVHNDDDDNLYFDIYAIRGHENKIMFSKNGVLIVSVQPPEEIHETFEKELWKYISSMLGVTMADLEILLFPFEAARRVLLKQGKMTQKECEDKIKDVLKPYIPTAAQNPEQTEPPPFLTPFDPLAIYAYNDTNQKEGPIKYYEVPIPKAPKTETKSQSIPRKKLVEMKPFYVKDPSWMAKILRDLRPNKEVILRGRLIPQAPLRPIVADYRGPQKVRLIRKILEGIADGSGVPKPNAKLRLEMSHPVPALMMLDFMSPDKKVVLSRRVISPLFRNDTVDIVEEFEYTEVA